MSEKKNYLDLLRKELVREWRGGESSLKDEYETLKPEYGDEIKELTEHINENLLKNDNRLKEKKKKQDNKKTWSVDSSTVERLFGYKDRDKWEGPSPITLSFLAKSLKYKSWGDFKLKTGNMYCPLIPTKDEVFESQREELRRLQEDMIRNKDGIYILGWYPEKYIKFKHVENYTYEVLESNRMNRKEGELFDAPDFCLSESTTEDSQLPDIMILDNIGYFREHNGEETNDYFKL